MMQHDIAAQVGVNQGRVCEVLTGKRFPPLSRDLFDTAS
jgi:predicted XRE-type DNA-binding protein